MTDNPFNKDSFKKIWLKYFNNSKEGEAFSFIRGVSFVKRNSLPVYVNVGDNLTDGLTYELDTINYNDYKGKVFLVRDIPSYLSLKASESESALKLRKVFQYEGYTTEISNYENLDQYMRSIFKSNSRYKFKRNMQRLESCFDIKYTMYHGEISSEEFKHVFDTFYKLLEKRYTNKQERCGELNPELWSYYCELAYTMINEKSASLFVIYNDKTPIGITFNYHFGSIFIEALTVFDIDYYKFNIGHTTIYKLLEWSFNNKVSLFDYTHGDFDYKKRWSSSRYQKHHHLFYDSSSLLCTSIAYVIEKKFVLKRILRDKKLIKKYHNFKYKLSNLDKGNIDQYSFNINVVEEALKYEQSDQIDIYDSRLMSLRKSVFDYYYKYPEPLTNVKFYECNSSENCIYAIGVKSNLKIEKTMIQR